MYNHSGSTLTITPTVDWYENGVLPAIGDTQPITDLIIDGFFEFQNQDTSTPGTFDTITINSGGVLTHEANGTTQVDTL